MHYMLQYIRGVYCSEFPPPRRGGIKCKVALMGKKMQGWGEKNSRPAEKIKGKKKGRKKKKIKEKSFKQQ